MSKVFNTLASMYYIGSTEVLAITIVYTSTLTTCNNIQIKMYTQSYVGQCWDTP